jgi:membrane protein DedA with SNARE-associated domain
LQAPVQKFAAAAVLATLVWTSGLFFISMKLGLLLMRYLGVWRWAGLAVFCLLLILIGRFATRLYNKGTHP